MNEIHNKCIINHGGNLEKQSRDLNIKTTEIIDSSASIVPFSPPKKFINHLIKEIKTNSIKYYPDAEHFTLKNAIGSWHCIDPSMILPGNGAAELITWCAREAQLNGLSAIPFPTFLDYERALNCWNAKYIHVPLPLSWDKTMPQEFPIKPKSDILWITNPHNPTGQLWDRTSIEKIICNYKLVICDEAFLSLVPHGETQSLLYLTQKYNNLIVLRSLTKLFGIAGLRIGYAVSQADRLNKWKGLRDPWPLNKIAISMGEILMKEKELHLKWIKKIHNWVQVEGQWLTKNLKDFKSLKVHPTSANFQLIESKESLMDLNKRLKYKGIILRDCRSFKGLGDKWLRISLQTRSNNIKLIESMKNIIK